MMKLYYSKNSPYARVIRVALFDINQRLDANEQVEQIEVITRTPDNAVLAHSPLGRVPTLVTHEFVLGETHNIYQYLQEISGPANAKTDWASIAADSMVTGFIDGVAVWGRESMFHQDGNTSEFVLNLEEERATRAMAYFENLWLKWQGPHPWDFSHIAMACALDMLGMFGRLPEWKESYPALCAWHETVKNLPSMLATAPEM